MITSSPSPITVWILAALAAGPNHAYGVTQQLQEDYKGLEYTSDRSVYAALKRMEVEKLVKGERVDATKHRRYFLTPFGRRILGREKLKAERLVLLVRQRL